jgi:hypothetical protein
MGMNIHIIFHQPYLKRFNRQVGAHFQNQMGLSEGSDGEEYPHHIPPAIYQKIQLSIQCLFSESDGVAVPTIVKPFSY